MGPFAAAWARGEAHARVALWAEDAGLINPSGVGAHARAATEKLFEAVFAGFRGRTTRTLSD